MANGVNGEASTQPHVETHNSKLSGDVLAAPMHISPLTFPFGFDRGPNVLPVATALLCRGHQSWLENFGARRV